MIRSSCVARGSLSSVGSSTVYTVPSGYAFLLKNYFLSNGAAGTNNTYFILQASPGPGQAVVEFLQLAAGAYHTWNGWTVLNAGDSIILNIASANVGYWITGAVLPYNPAF